MEKMLIFLHIRKAGGTTIKSIVKSNYSNNNILEFDVSGMKNAKEFLDADNRQLSVIQGQMPFGLHQFLPSPSVYITMLRDPIDRVISYYYYILQRPDHYAYNQV